MINNHYVWLDMFAATMQQPEIAVRGSVIKEVMNLSITIDPSKPFMTFEARKTSVDYVRKEIQWYIGADRFDQRIIKHAPIWGDMLNFDGSFNSNYGQYWFKPFNGLFKAFKQLQLDKFTRRATVPMLRSEHVDLDVKDSVCTEALTFLIRNEQLHCIVHMRSSDQIFGLGNDIPTFSFAQQVMLAMVNTCYHDVTLGSMSITAASSHIYARHFKLVQDILDNPSIDLTLDVAFPPITLSDIAHLFDCFSGMPVSNHKPFTDWLLKVSL